MQKRAVERGNGNEWATSTPDCEFKPISLTREAIIQFPSDFEDSNMAEDGWPTIAQKELVYYAQAYISEFNNLRRELERRGPPASLYSHELAGASVFLAKDGAAILYMDEYNREKSNHPKGVIAQDLGEETLTHFVQSGTANCVKIMQWKVGDYIGGPLELPADLPPEELKGGISPEFLRPHLDSGMGANVQGLAVSPTWNVENGIFTRMLPTRARVFSPATNLPTSGKFVLQNIFPFMDLIWLVDELGLNAQSARKWATADIEVLLLGLAAGIPQKELSENPFESVATHCEKVCDEFFTLIDNPSTREMEVQAFLEVPAHEFLITPHCREVFPHKPLGGNRFVPDFVVHRPDGDYHFVEIESPNSLIYQGQGQEPTAGFSHAIQQVEDWLRYIDQNLLTVRNEERMPTIYKPTGEVVIGREKHIGETAKTRFQFKRAESGRIVLKTYDMMVSEGRAYATSLRRMRGGL